MAEIRINATGGVKLYDADDSHYCQILAGTITANVDILTLNSAGITVADGAIDFDIASHDTSNGLKLGGTLVTATAAELNIMDGVTSTAAELNIMDGVGATASEINLIDGSAKSTSSITIADADAFIVIDGTTTKQIPASDITTYVGGVSLSGSTNNTVASVTGANALIGEVKLLFDPPKLTIGNATAEDTSIVFDGNAQDWHIGLDDSEDDFTIGLGSTLGTTSHIVIDEAGAVTKPLQPCFHGAYSSSQTIDNATVTTVAFDAERFDQNSDYDLGTYTFTAPVTGKYFFSATFAFDAGAGTYTDFISVALSLIASNVSIGYTKRIKGTNVYDNAETHFNMIMDMDAADTCYQTCYIQRLSGTGTTNIIGGRFVGWLVC